jgi:beta-galactosidase
MGFYVYEEAFDKWMSGSYARYFTENWKHDIEVMVKRDRNRPSIIIWGTGNEVENQGQESMLALLKMIRDYINELDNTRPITYAMNPHFKRESGIDAARVKDIQKFVDVADDHSITDMDEKLQRIKKITEIVDIISCNYQEQWYDGIHRLCPDMLILGTEVYQYFVGHRDNMKNFSNDNPSLVPIERDYVIGGIVWSGYDYLGESTGWPAKGWSGAPIRTNNEKRFSYYIFQSYWSAAPMVRFNVMDYSLEDEGVKEHWDMPLFAEHWHFPQFRNVIIPYAIASNCDEVALYLNGQRYYLPKPDECPNRVITGFLPYFPGKVKVVGLKDGMEVCHHDLTTPGPAVKLEFDYPQRLVVPEEGYELLLTVRAKDESGNQYFRESSPVRFTIEGSAEILAVDSGRMKSDEPYCATSVHMFHGCASVLIRLNGDSGCAVVRADAQGMLSGVVVVEVK